MRLVPDDLWAIMTIWQEARGEPHRGKVGVAEVILNRTKAKRYSDGTVAGTIFRPWQFSGWNTTDPNRVPAAKLDDQDPSVIDCATAWADAKAGSDLTKGATLYYNPATSNPRWAERCVETAIIGAHRFMREVKDGK